MFCTAAGTMTIYLNSFKGCSKVWRYAHPSSLCMAELCLDAFTWENGLHKPLCHDRLSHIPYVTCNTYMKKSLMMQEGLGIKLQYLYLLFFFFEKENHKMYYPWKSTQWSVLDSANWRLLAGGSMPPVYPLLPPSVNQMSMIVQYDLAFYTVLPHGCVRMHNMTSLLKIESYVRTYISS